MKLRDELMPNMANTICKGISTKPCGNPKKSHDIWCKGCTKIVKDQKISQCRAFSSDMATCPGTKKRFYFPVNRI